MAQIITKHNGGMAFTSNIDGHSISLDADSKFGGDDSGPQPKPLLLLSLVGTVVPPNARTIHFMKPNPARPRPKTERIPGSGT